MSLRVKIKKNHPDAILPKYAHGGDAGIDLFSNEDFELKNNVRDAVPTGISVEIPKGYVGLIWDKSGIATKEGIKTIGGVIDSTFRGELKIAVINLSGKTYKFLKGHKIAQMLVQKIESVEIIEVDKLSDTTRGDKGYGSSGK